MATNGTSSILPVVKAPDRERASDTHAAAEVVRVRRLREDATRPMAQNLAETIALSHAYLRLAGVAKSR